MMVWSIDADFDDWTSGTTEDVLLERTIARLEEAGKGILLIHDIQPVTVRVTSALVG